MTHRTPWFFPLLHSAISAALLTLLLVACSGGGPGNTVSAGGNGSGTVNGGNGDGSGGNVGAGGGGTNTGTSIINLSWDPPSASTDGSAVNILGYKIYYGTASGNYTQELDLASTSAPTATAITIANLAPRTAYYFAIKAYDTLYNYSDFSGEVRITTN